MLFATWRGNRQPLMYRYSLDNAVTYTSEDFVLFRESPFASWMERLSLENPDHGIPPDVGSLSPLSTMERQDDIAETLRAEERNVALIDWDDAEPTRRAATLDAMRSGVDFVVNGQLALGPLSGSANLLMRTSGYSELGDYLYIPCDTQARTSMHSGFRLCFLADLLHSLQGQLPPQMLIIRSGADVMPLQSEDRIYHYRAVKQRFMEAMRTFRKHRMPDPAESSHFGRWSDCANEVLKQRALREEDGETHLSDSGEQLFEMPLQKVVGANASPEPDLSAVAAPEATGTLAEQARQIMPGTYQVEPREVRGVSARTTFRRGRSLRGADHIAPTVPTVPAASLESVAEHALAAPLQEPTMQPLLQREFLSISAADKKALQSSPEALAYADAALDNLEFIGSREGASASSPASWSQLDQQAYEVEMPQSGFTVPPVDTLELDCNEVDTSQNWSESPVAPGPEAPAAGLTPAIGSTVNNVVASDPWAVALELMPEELESIKGAAGEEPEAPPPNLGVAFDSELPREQIVEPAAKPHPLDSVGFSFSEPSLVDKDDASIEPTRALEAEIAEPAGFHFHPADDQSFDVDEKLAEDRRPFGRATEAADKPEVASTWSFNDSLITNGEFED